MKKHRFFAWMTVKGRTEFMKTDNKRKGCELIHACCSRKSCFPGKQYISLDKSMKDLYNVR